MSRQVALNSREFLSSRHLKADAGTATTAAIESRLAYLLHGLTDLNFLLLLLLLLLLLVNKVLLLLLNQTFRGTEVACVKLDDLAANLLVGTEVTLACVWAKVDKSASLSG